MIRALTLSAPSRPHREAAELTRLRSQSTSNDRHEINEQTPSNLQRQQQATLPQQPPASTTPERFSSPASSQHRLRRTPKFEATPSPEPRLVHVAAASVGFSPVPPASQGKEIHAGKQQAPSGAELSEHQRRRISSQDLTEDPDEQSSGPVLPQSHSASSPAPSRRPAAHPVVRVSKHTHSAILYALEEALRQPNPFTPDIVEESASMADLISGRGATPTSNGHGLPTPHVPAAAPVPTTSPSGIRGPRVIMAERQAREQARQAEAQRIQLERERAEQEAQEAQEARQREESQRNEMARRNAAGVVTQRPGDTRIPSQDPGASQPPITNPQTPQPTHSHQRTNNAAYTTNQQASMPTYAQQPAPVPQRQHEPRPSQSRQPPSQKPGDTSDPNQAGSSSSKPRNSFPHAFERWETLSAHWEGLTSYWIRRLEQNKDDLSRDPVSQQLARQVTDLSAAGANLFHAVVELQRLRASSERKFQRWFFETRAELERAQEVNSMLENALEQERRNRDEAIREAVEKEQGSSLAQKQLAEMRRELAISKDEARRAWEELGRREQAEQDRTLSLQSGQPTIVGGVQVVPMTQPSRHAQPGYQQPYAPESVPSPTPAAGSEGYYQQQQPSQQPAAYPGGAPPRGYSDGEYVVDVQGNPILDMHGKKIPFAVPPSSYSGSDAEAEEYDTPATTNPPSGSYDPPPTSAPGGQWTGAYSNPQDYSGEGYGESSWGDQRPTHHHPTRLSDVIEEDDERSRTSASQVDRS